MKAARFLGDARIEITDAQGRSVFGAIEQVMTNAD